jgi:spermidine/putrescine ABC transporter ATP-binding subunit
MESKGSGVRLENIVKKFGDVAAVDDITLEAVGGEFLTLLGPSGSGKTTTLRIISGLEFPTAGQVYIDGEFVNDKPAYQRDLGMVFQNYALFPHMSIFENVGFPLKMRGVSKEEIRKKVQKSLEIVQLSKFERRHPKQLSGGQQQRVALARALVFEPSVLLMDEPLGALDKKLREEMQMEIKHIQKGLNITTIYVTHDQSEALTMSDRVILMNNGKIEQVGSPEELYETPKNKFVASFIGESNFLEGFVVKIENLYCEVKTTKGLTVKAKLRENIQQEQKVNLTVRPERIQVQESVLRNPNQFKGYIKELIYLGETVKYIITLEGGEEVIAKAQNIARDVQREKGKEILVAWNPDHCFIV